MVDLLCALLFSSQGAPPPVQVRLGTFEGWPDSYRVSNGLVDFVVAPKIGRIMRFGAVGKANLIWESSRVSGEPPSSGGWMNWGGDKVWPAPQSAWGWPPEREYDGVAWDVTPLPNGVRMASKSPSAKLGVRFERVITLDRGSRALKATNTLFNDSGKTARFAVWEICQIDNPTACILPIPPSSGSSRGWRVFDNQDIRGLAVENGDRLTIQRDRKRGIKYGSSSSQGFVSAIVKGFRINVQTSYKQGGEYPDQASPLQVYTSADPLKYCELEVTGPLVDLKTGESTSIVVTLGLGVPPDRAR